MNDFPLRIVLGGIALFSTVLMPPFAHAIEGEAEFVEKEIRAVREAVREVVKIPPPPEPDAGKTDFVIMPIPISNPTVGTGLGAVSMFLYKAGEKAPTSSTAFGGFYTNNDSWGVGVSQKTYLREDRFRLNGLLGYGNINIDFSGIGTELGNQGVTVPVTWKGTFFVPDFLVRFAEHFYGGLRYRFLEMETGVDPQKISVGGKPIFPGVDWTAESRVRSSGLGPVMNYDSRDNTFFPHRGTFLDVNAIFASESLGSDFDYQIYQGAYNSYFRIAETMTLAYRLYGRFTAGRVPLYDLSYFGAHNDLRGYAAGQYVDKSMIATQLEFRWKFWKRWGMVAFGGIGEVARDLRGFDLGSLLPSAGAGLRYMVSEKERVNVSVDYARGREGDAVYFYIGEAF
jgi:hypothetical protein